MYVSVEVRSLAFQSLLWKCGVALREAREGRLSRFVEIVQGLHGLKRHVVPTLFPSHTENVPQAKMQPTRANISNDIEY